MKYIHFTEKKSRLRKGKRIVPVNQDLSPCSVTLKSVPAIEHPTNNHGKDQKWQKTIFDSRDGVIQPPYFTEGKTGPGRGRD